MTDQPGPGAAPPPFICQFCGWSSDWPNERQGCPLCFRERLKRSALESPPARRGWWEGEGRVITEDDGDPN
jgi:hypothetical protein